MCSRPDVLPCLLYSYERLSFEISELFDIPPHFTCIGQIVNFGHLKKLDHESKSTLAFIDWILELDRRFALPRGKILTVPVMPSVSTQTQPASIIPSVWACCSTTAAWSARQFRMITRAPAGENHTITWNLTEMACCLYDEILTSVLAARIQSLRQNTNLHGYCVINQSV